MSDWGPTNIRTHRSGGTAGSCGGHEPSYVERLEHFRAKWVPVRVKKMRQNKEIEHFRDSEKRGNALAKLQRRHAEQLGCERNGLSQIHARRLESGPKA